MNGSSVVLIALFTSALTASGTTYLIQRYQVFAEPEQARHVVAPQLLGLSEADARANAQALQLPLLVEGREPSSAAVGTVLRQSIAAGQPVPQGVGIGVVFAAALPSVPNVTELMLAEAREALARHGFKVLEGGPLPHAEIEAGRVVQQVPAAQSELEPGGVVTLHLSSGPAEVVAPKLLGMRLEAARAALSELGLGMKVRWISRAETVTHTVLSQKPGTGQKVVPRSTVEVVVNR